MAPRSFSLLTADDTVFARFRALGDATAVHRLGDLAELDSLPAGELVVIDLAHPDLPPAFEASRWFAWCGHLSVIVISSAPNDEEGLAALDAGAAGYCHAYSAPETLRNVLDVVASGELWVGRSLMTRLLRGVSSGRASSTGSGWTQRLTEREREVAQLAANGDSNLFIADALGITERTVKAHLSAVFDKLQVNDRLQLALKVHGIKP